MKTLLVTLLVAVLLAMGATSATASTTTTPASGGTSVSADWAQNGIAPAFSTLGSVVIAEASNNDFKTSGTLVLTAPSGWRFNTAAAVSRDAGQGGRRLDPGRHLGLGRRHHGVVDHHQHHGRCYGPARQPHVERHPGPGHRGGSLPAAGNMLRSSADPGTATIVGCEQ
jgi:hypothetical protein